MTQSTAEITGDFKQIKDTVVADLPKFYLGLSLTFHWPKNTLIMSVIMDMMTEWRVLAVLPFLPQEV